MGISTDVFLTELGDSESSICVYVQWACGAMNYSGSVVEVCSALSAQGFAERGDVDTGYCLNFGPIFFNDQP